MITIGITTGGMTIGVTIGGITIGGVTIGIITTTETPSAAGRGRDLDGSPRAGE
jgi:hypothetical protein